MGSKKDNLTHYSSSESEEEEVTIPEKHRSEKESKKSPSNEKEATSKDKHIDKHRRKEDRRHEKHAKHHKRRSSRDDRDRSKRRFNDEDDHSRSRRDKDRKVDKHDKRRSSSKPRTDRRSSKQKKDRRRSRSKSDDRRVKDKHRRKYDEKKNKNRNRSKSQERSRRRSSSGSPEKEKKIAPKPVESPIVKLLASTSVSSSPQKSPMISLSTPIVLQPVEPKIELPSYYNPNVINVTKFAEQQKKRKMLWSGKKDEPAKDAAKWEGAQFSQDVDGSKATKFMRLMGIKDAAPKAEATVPAKPSDEMFSTMEHQYEVARQVTHISRGVGLGFGSRPF